jgi:4-coumarate--CoA ligase
MVRKFSMSALLEAVTKHQITELLLVPPILIRFVRDPIVDMYDLSHVRVFASGAAPLAKEIIHQLSRKFPKAGIKQGYGMTETCACLTATQVQDCNWTNAHSVGKLVPSTTIKIVDPEDSDKELPDGVPGEILAKGPQVVQGYLDNDAANASTFTPDGWLRTGDQGMVDSNGMVYITDRLKELIKVRGTQVAPAELEDLLLQHPAVEDCGVTGMPDEYSGEAPRAYVVVSSNYKSDDMLKDELKKFIAERRVREKWLAGGVIFIDAIPKSPSGKILRRMLRNLEDVKAKL